MATSKEVEFKDIPLATRKQAVQTRLSQAQNQLYNLHLTEAEGNSVNEPERDRLTKAIAALTAIRDELNAEEAKDQ